MLREKGYHSKTSISQSANISAKTSISLLCQPRTALNICIELAFDLRNYAQYFSVPHIQVFA